MKRTSQSLAILLLLLTSLSVAQAQTPATAPHGTASAQPAASAEAIWADLMAGNKRYVTGKSEAHDLVQLRQSLAKDQHPKVVVLGCSDSRVPPEVLFDQTLGDLFVVRSAGNIAGAIGLGSIEYGVEHLGSSVLVVLGHTSCGAVKAACAGGKAPSSNLQAIVDKIEPAVVRARSHAQADELVDAAVRENVQQSATDILASSAVLKHEFEAGKLTIIEAVYSLDTGEVARLGKLASAATAAH
jgi:carbonic anhydrase